MSCLDAPRVNSGVPPMFQRFLWYRQGWSARFSCFVSDSVSFPSTSLFLPLFFFIASSNHRGSYGRRSLGRPRVHENISLYEAGLPNAQALSADQEALVNAGGMRQKLQATGFFMEASLTVTQYEEEKNWYAFKPRGQTAHTT